MVVVPATFLFGHATVRLFAGAVSGVSFLHELGVVHMDLKPGNIMFARASNTPGDVILKIGDLGLAGCESRLLLLSSSFYFIVHFSSISQHILIFFPKFELLLHLGFHPMVCNHYQSWRW